MPPDPDDLASPSPIPDHSPLLAIAGSNPAPAGSNLRPPPRRCACRQVALHSAAYTPYPASATAPFCNSPSHLQNRSVPRSRRPTLTTLPRNYCLLSRLHGGALPLDQLAPYRDKSALSESALADLPDCALALYQGRVGP